MWVGFCKCQQMPILIFDIDMTERYEEFMNSYEQEVVLLNFSLSKLADIATESLYTGESFKYKLDFDENCFKFNINSDEKVEIAHIASMYIEEFNKIKL